MPVPGVWELNGYGDPLYVNVGYAWREQFKNNPPEVPTVNNHVGSYRREIMVPASWNGKEIIAHFGSVTSNMYLWVNGKYVGYSEDSKLEAEFNLTPYLKPGQKNPDCFPKYSAGVMALIWKTKISSVTAVSDVIVIYTPVTQSNRSPIYV